MVSKRVRSKTLRKRLLLIPALPLALWVVVMLVVSNQSSQLKTTAQDFAERDLALYRQLNELYVSMSAGHVHIFSLLQQAKETGEHSAEQLYEAITEQVDTMDRIGHRFVQLDYSRLDMTAEEQAGFRAEVAEDYRQYRGQVVQALRLASVDFDNAYRAMTESDDAFHHLAEEIRFALKIIEANFLTNFQRLESDFESSSAVIIVLVSIISFFIALICYLIYHRLSEGIQESLDLADAIRNGTLGRKPGYYDTDELGDLARYIHRMGSRLDELHRHLEEKVRARTQELEQLTQRLKTEIHLRKQAAEELKRLAETDPLTGLYNRRFFMNRINHEWSKERRQGDQLSLLLIDVDHFKQINDDYGHQVGDACLKELASTLHRCAKRMTDTVARFGGEEFIVYLPNTPLEEAKKLAECILQQVMAIELSPVTDKGPLTVSIGVSCLSEDCPTPELIIHAADQAMYAAKHAGRNRLRVAD